jgi:Na+/glutamate symporter
MDRSWRFWKSPVPVEPVQTDDELGEESRRIAVEKEKTDLEKQNEQLEAEKENRKLRRGWAIGAVIVMLIQIAVADAIFVWYGDTNAWDIPTVAISIWLSATVVQVVSVVLVITHYLFSTEKSKSEN